MRLNIGRTVLRNIKLSAVYVIATVITFGSVSFAAPGFLGQVAYATPTPVATYTVCAMGCDYATIQGAIAASTSGDTIQVAAGTYVESGQIVIDKNLTIIGADKATTIIQTDQSTGSGGNAGGWFLVNAGFTFNISNLTIDGTGFDVRQAIRSLGDLNVDNCAFENIAYPGYLGWGVVMFANGTVNNSQFTNIGRIGINAAGDNTRTVSITNNTYTGKGAGDYLDYGIVVNYGATATISGNTISNIYGVAVSDGSTSAATMITTGFGAGTNVTYTGNTIFDASYGVAVGGNIANGNPTVTLSGNSITNISDYAVESYVTDGTNYPQIVATENWWGNITGPLQATTNPTGLGVEVSDRVSYRPWFVDASMTTLSNSGLISKFTIPSQIGATVIDNTTHTISVVMPNGTNLAALTPTLTPDNSVRFISGITNNFSSPVNYTVTTVDGTNIVYTVNVTIDPVDAAFDAVASALGSVDGISSNLGNVTSANASEFTGLYFEKSVDDVTMGRITFNGTLDLTDPATIAFLQQLGDRMNAGTPGVISLDFRGVSDLLALKGVSATITFYNLDKLGFTDSSTATEVYNKLVVLDDNGYTLNKADVLVGDGVYVGACTDGMTDCYTFTIGVKHFTQFKISKPIVVSTTATTVVAQAQPVVVATAPVQSEVIVSDTVAQPVVTQTAPATLGTETTKTTADKVDTVANANTDWQIFGLAWYWWLLIAAAIGSGWWIKTAVVGRNKD
jgi:Pectate lyase superfamily protein